MRIVVATEENKEKNAAAHFAHCSHFVVFEINNGKVKSSKSVRNPYFQKHVPGAIPEFVESLGADVLITGGIGANAIALLEKMEIEVVYGTKGRAEHLVDKYLKGNMDSKKNPCNH